jgi:hypothetical protein
LPARGGSCTQRVGFIAEVDVAGEVVGAGAIILEVRAANRMIAFDPPQSVYPETLKAIYPEGIVEIDGVADHAAFSIEADSDVRREEKSAHVHDRGCVEWIAILRLCRSDTDDPEEDYVSYYCSHTRPRYQPGIAYQEIVETRMPVPPVRNYLVRSRYART